MTSEHHCDRAADPTVANSAEEVDRRRAAVDFARRNVRYEGFVLSAEAEAISRRFIAGEIDAGEHAAAIAALG